MQSYSDNHQDYTDRDSQIPLSRIDLMVTFHMLRNAYPAISLAVRNHAIIYQSNAVVIDLHTVSKTITALCNLKIPESIELKKTLSKLLNRWITTEKILQEIEFGQPRR